MRDLRASMQQRVGGSPAEGRARLTEGRLGRIATRLVVGELLLVAGLAAIVWHNKASATDSIDRTVARALYARPGTLLRSVFGALTFLGEPPLAWFAAFLVGVWVWRRTGDRLLAAYCPAVVLISEGLEKAVKSFVSRSRPATAFLAHESGHSFPSGHATAAAALAFSVSLLLVACRVPRAKLGAIGLLIYTTVIAASRVVLGVHFLTDVVAANALAGAVALTVAWLFSGPTQHLADEDGLASDSRSVPDG